MVLVDKFHTGYYNLIIITNRCVMSEEEKNLSNVESETSPQVASLEESPDNSCEHVDKSVCTKTTDSE